MGDRDLELSEPASRSAETASTSIVPPERVFAGTGLVWGLIVGFVLAAAVVALAAQNTGTTTISFLGWAFSTPLIVVILGSLLIGVVLDEVFGLIHRSRRRRTLRDRDDLRRLG